MDANNNGAQGNPGGPKMRRDIAQSAIDEIQDLCANPCAAEHDGNTLQFWPVVQSIWRDAMRMAMMPEMPPSIVPLSTTALSQDPFKIIEGIAGSVMT